FVTELRGMAVVLEVIFAPALALDVHVARVPVARFHGGLWSPMRPDPELGVANPVGDMIFRQRFASGLERPRCILCREVGFLLCSGSKRTERRNGARQQ